MKFSLAEVAQATAGTVLNDAGSTQVDGAGIDSRTVEPASLFVPIVAERDGHDFVDGAMASGAVAHLTEHESSPHPAVRVTDTTLAIQALGRAARERMDGPVVGITGSVGKTTTKDMALAALSRGLRTHASYRSFNNELGVPLTLVNTPEATEAVVVEMGARGQGHIAELCAIAAPTIGVVLLVGEAHTELFGDVDGVAQAKGELVEALPASGTAILNTEDHRVMAMASRTQASVLRFGPGGDVAAQDIVLDALLRPRFTMVSPWGSAQVQLPSSGIHTVTNGLAAAAVALAAGVSVDDVAAGLGDAQVSPWRMEVHTLSSGATVVNDAYNANPMSMGAALDSLEAMDARRRIAILGVMAELGDDRVQQHRAIGQRVTGAGTELIAVDVPVYGGTAVADRHEALAALQQLGPLGDGDVILVKASRVAQLELLVQDLLEQQ